MNNQDFWRAICGRCATSAGQIFCIASEMNAYATINADMKFSLVLKYKILHIRCSFILSHSCKSLDNNFMCKQEKERGFGHMSMWVLRKSNSMARIIFFASIAMSRWSKQSVFTEWFVALRRSIRCKMTIFGVLERRALNSYSTVFDIIHVQSNFSAYLWMNSNFWAYEWFGSEALAFCKRRGREWERVENSEK